MISPRWSRLGSSLCLLVPLALGGCDKDEQDPAAQPEPAADPAGEPAAATPASDASDDDKGFAKLKLGEADWGTERASARLKDDGRLRILASRSESADGKTRREALTLEIPSYTGPGSYTLENVNSNFTGVGINLEAIEQAEADKDDAKTTEIATDSIQGATVVLLRGAQIEITKADERFIDGTLEWSGITSVKGPRSIKGEFHARIKE